METYYFISFLKYFLNYFGRVTLHGHVGVGTILLPKASYRLLNKNPTPSVEYPLFGVVSLGESQRP